MKSHIREILTPCGQLPDANARLRHPAEKAAWIWHPDKKRGETAVLRFSLRFSLTEPCQPLVHVTGDHRFQLRCDGLDLGYGPDRCDLEHWTVQSYRLDLEAGEHEFEALVWWIAEPEVSQRVDQEVLDDTPKPPMAQMTWRSGFLLHGEDLPEVDINTGSAEWKVEDLTGAVRMYQKRIPQYFDIGPSFDFGMEAWKTGVPTRAIVVEPPLQPNVFGVRRPGWCLYPANLPEQKREVWKGGRLRAVRTDWDEIAFTADDIRRADTWGSFLDERYTVPAHSKATILWDLESYICGYPHIDAKGEGSVIEWEWAEALYEEPGTSAIKHSSSKGQRDEILGKAYLGVGDSWRLGAGSFAVFPALWWRSGRYIRLRISTGSLPLELKSLAILTTGFPLNRCGLWKSSDDGWDRLMPIFERAFVSAAHETWTDSPYYEQMCYVGDNALHMLANYAWFDDDRISKRSLKLFDWSRRPSGLVAERYPSAWRQESVTYSMLWPMMIRDFVWWRNDTEFVRSLLPGMRAMLAEIEGYRHEEDLLVEAPGWPFVDWVRGWEQGCGPGVREGDSSIVNLHWVLCLQAAASVERACGDPILAQRNDGSAARIFSAVERRYWDEGRGLFLDTPGVAQSSEHAQVFALLTGLLDPVKTQKTLASLRGSGSGLSPATIYAAFYVLEALYRHGEEEEFHRRLTFWRSLPGQGFTSTPESPEPSRSDAHAWGAHPAWHSAASIAGIRPAAAGFRKVSIAPCLGTFREVECSVNHPLGQVEVKLSLSENGLSMVSHLPRDTPGELIWRGRSVELHPGKSEYSLPL